MIRNSLLFSDQHGHELTVHSGKEEMVGVALMII